jgi:hypothetical protein
MDTYKRVAILMKEFGLMRIASEQPDLSLHDKLVLLEKEIRLEFNCYDCLIPRVIALEEKHARLVAKTDRMLALLGVTRSGTWSQRVHYPLRQLTYHLYAPIINTFELLEKWVIDTKLDNFEAALGMVKTPILPVDRLEAVERECGLTASPDSNIMDRIEAVQKQLY